MQGLIYPGGTPDFPESGLYIGNQAKTPNYAPLDFSVGGGLDAGLYTPQSGGYDYEWMNALNQATDVLAKATPVLGDLLHATGIVPEPAPPAAPEPPASGGGIVVKPVPWYENIPPWALAAGAAVGAVLLFKLLED